MVSCQSLPEGAYNAWRRMIFEDERAPADDQLGFVLHLGDFIYEVVQYPEQVAANGKRYDRTITFPVRFPDGQKVAGGRFMAPASLADYRALYQACLRDPDLQDARARWPFVAIWDNHEFSWQGWQSIAGFGEGPVPAQRLKVAANQAWFEYLPARVLAPGRRLDRFQAPAVENVPVTGFDEDGLGTEPNNRAAIESLIAWRALRWGRHLELLITDQRSFRSPDPSSREELRPLLGDDSLPFQPEALVRQLDGGRAVEGGPAPVLRCRGREIPNFRAGEPPQSMLGARQKAWFLERLRNARATWKIWGNSLGTLDWRVDPQNLPKDLLDWRDGYAVLAVGDWGSMYHERAQILDAVRDAGITGFAILSGDRHSFWAGYAARSLPPAQFTPVGLGFVVGSITSPGFAEAWEHGRADHPLRPLFIADRGDGRREHTVNLLLRHGVRSALEYARSGDLARALALRNPALAPHLEFVDMGGHGYATVRLDDGRMHTDFVCIPRPLARHPGPNGGPLRYRVRLEADLWQPGEHPVLRRTVLEGDPGLSAS